MKKLPRVLVGIQAGSIVDSFFAKNYPSALIGNGELFFAEQLWTIGHITDDGRNVVAKTAIEKEFDYVFYMDSDMIFPKGALLKIMQKMIDPDNNAMVIGGLYNTRGDHRTNAYSWDKKNNAYESRYFDLETGMYRVDAVATGCLLLDTDVFRQMEFPYFEYWYKKGPKSEKDRWSEDIVFAHKCMELGIPHYVDTDVVCRHLHNVCIIQSSKNQYQIEKMSGEVYETVNTKAKYL